MSPHRLSPGERLELGARHSVVVCDGPHAIARARAGVRDLVAGRLGDDRLADSLLLTSEAVTNGLVHAGEGPATLWAGIDDRRLRVEVHDSGPGLGRLGAPRRAPGPARFDGRGLFLLDRLADRWGHRDGPRPMVWFEMDCAETASA